MERANELPQRASAFVYQLILTAFRNINIPTGDRIGSNSARSLLDRIVDTEHFLALSWVGEIDRINFWNIFDDENLAPFLFFT